MADAIDYGNLMHNAMRELIKQVLRDVQANGLPGDHHFFITFDTTHPDVQLAVWLTERYPSEMTVVVQHWYEGLEVTEDGFAITLNFGDAPEPLYVPFDAMHTFVDPSVEFGLRFEQNTSEDEAELALAPLASVGEDADVSDAPQPVAEEPEEPEEPEESAPDAPAKDAEIVSLDSFRK